MKSLCALLFVLVNACGDNALECGPGTSNGGGLCTPDGSTICGDGTKLDPATNACLPDPTLCSGGTVLINGACQDPTAGLTIDLEEGPEPNGFEPDATTAGTIGLKPIGDPNGFVVHGCIRPVADQADLDDYRITVAAPTLIDVTADGVRGLAAGFVALGDDPALATWQRFGVNLATDTSHRELYLPKAGTYELVISDTRSLMGLLDGGTTAPPAGNPDGTSCYFVTINQLAVPRPSSLAVPVGINDTIDNKVAFYSAVLPTGVIDLQETIYSPDAAPAFVVDVSGELHLDHAGEVAFAGVKPTDTTLVAVDVVYNYDFTPPTYSVSFAAATTAQALPTDGTTVTAMSKTQVGTSFNTTNQFYFDASVAVPYGIDLASTRPIQGVIWDSELNVVDDFGGFAAQQSFTSWNGLWVAPKPGRYYFALIDPVDGAGTPYTITSTIAPATRHGLAVDTPLTAQVPNQFQSNLYTLALDLDEWDLFNVTTTNLPGPVSVTVFDDETAIGRLDPVIVTTSSGTAVLAPTAPVTLAFEFPPTGAPQGFLVATLPHVPHYLTVRTNPPSGAATFDLDVETRAHADLSPTTQTLASETAPLGDAHRYFMPVVPGTHVQLTVTPSTGTQDPILETLSPNESVLATSDHPAGAAETLTMMIGLEGYLAFQVRGATVQTYGLGVVVTPPFYTPHATTTAYANACTSGTELQLHDNISDPQVTPSTFRFYGVAINQYLITASGYLTFDLADHGVAAPTAMPDGAGIVNIAPLWQPLTDATVCTTIIGTKTVIQWSTTTVQAQAILDSSDSSIEFVYGPNNHASSVAVAGVQDPTGTTATPTGNGAIAPFATPGTSRKLTHP